jgi:dolichol-phosphate mannosyltransferase
MLPLIVKDFSSQEILEMKEVSLSVVLPTYNEKSNIAEVIKQVCSILDGLLPNKYELIIVDDDSPDGTWAVAQSLMPQYPHLIVIRRQDERGLATAVIRGWQVARGRVLGVMDADLQHPPDVLIKLLRMMETVDMAVASRNSEGGSVSDWSFLRRCVSRGAQLLGLLILPEVVGRVSDPLSGCFMVRRNIISGKVLDPVGYKILIEVLAKGNKTKVGEVGYVFKEREKDSSKANLKIYSDYLIHLYKLRFSKKI